MDTGGVCKRVLHAGTGDIPKYSDGSKLTFHFQCQRLDRDGEEAIIDDSKKAGKPMELILGKQFKMPHWEQCLKTMRVKEVAQFVMDKSLVDAYPIVSKSYRQFAGLIKGDQRTHCCGMMSLKDGFGSKELDELMHVPCDLQFTFELLKIEAPGEYEKESWSMNPEEKLQSIPHLRERGNDLYNRKMYKEASDKYAEALVRLEQLLLREKPGEEEWQELEKIKIPLLLNFSQCKLIEKDYYPVIEHTTMVLERDPDNVKALYRRAKAHIGAWNLEDAEADYLRILKLDHSLTSVVNRELKNIKLLRKQKDLEDRAMLCGKGKETRSGALKIGVLKRDRDPIRNINLNEEVA